MSNKAIELAKSLVSEWHEDQINFDTALSAAAELRALHAEVEVLRKDAARYRYVVDNLAALCEYPDGETGDEIGVLSFKSIKPAKFNIDYDFPYAVNQAIDAAMQN
jgi:hypothetical protein